MNPWEYLSGAANNLMAPNMPNPWDANTTLQDAYDWGDKNLVEGLPYAGMTKVLGQPGGMRMIKSYNDKIGKYLGEMAYQDVPGKGAIVKSIKTESPRGTAEIFNRFAEEMGPYMDNVRIGTPIMPQATPFFQRTIDRGRLDQWPNLKDRLQSSIEQTVRDRYELIPDRLWR